MSEGSPKGLTRRDLLGKTVGWAGAALFVPALVRLDRSGDARRPTSYGVLGDDAATFTEALVNALCPADPRTPNGVQCGLVTSIDRQLAGEFGAQPSSEWPLSKAELFEKGAAAADAASRARHGMPFEGLTARQAGVFLAAVASGRLSDSDPALRPWYRQIVQPLLVQASLSGPIYGRYGNRVFTKLF